jgi:hypothetical protein
MNRVTALRYEELQRMQEFVLTDEWLYEDGSRRARRSLCPGLR